MRLTKRQRQLLELMMTGEEECVEDGGEVWIGEERTNVRTLCFFLRNGLLKGPDESGGSRVYELNEWGVRAVVEMGFDPQAELRKAIQAAEAAGKEGG